MIKKAFIIFNYETEEDLKHILENIAEEMPGTLAPFNFPLYRSGENPERAGQVEVFENNPDGD
jgi:hypothetical protein